MAKKLNPKSLQKLEFMVTEAYNKARTNLIYSITKKGCKKIIFTSPSQGDGKTTTAVNTAKALAQQLNTKVIVIDCDLRRPAAHTFFNLDGSTKGLANLLNGECSLEEAIVKTDNENLSLITFGAVPPNPSELLMSEGMTSLVEKLGETYDYIIFDTPPVNTVIDVITLISRSDGVVLVVKDKSTTTGKLTNAVDTLRRNQAKIVGVIVNGVPSGVKLKGSSYSGSKGTIVYE